MTASSEIVDGLVCSMVFCDGGPGKFPELERHTVFSSVPGATIYGLRRELRAEGWTHDKSGDYCPFCTKPKEERARQRKQAKAVRNARVETRLLDHDVGALMNDARGG